MKNFQSKISSIIMKHKNKSSVKSSPPVKNRATIRKSATIQKPRTVEKTPPVAEEKQRAVKTDVQKSIKAITPKPTIPSSSIRFDSPDSDDEINLFTYRNPIPESINKQSKKNIIPKNSDQLSSSTIAHDTDSETGKLQPNKSQVQKRRSDEWAYATRCTDRNYAKCNLCSSERPRIISTNGGSTTYLRSHLVTKHNKTDLVKPVTERKIKTNNLQLDLKQKYHELAVNAVIRDGTACNDL
ncbi:unnamed protein product [Didymodactylos carnosus]|uniref:BED-type domain-containing protein n=1 Tax=Didymodactylos carnosus TaxID=1234261 RepID=A0A8S2E9R2_9BILA|nr:unnamed protein product [Didymodactylos carnosus]CAF3849857.1 unnamed protein product [Didymodactylos carnosus]